MLLAKLKQIDSDKLRHLNPEAAEILTNVLQAYSAILKRRNQLDAEGKHAEPLHIVIGEEHTRPAHKIFQTLLINLLKEAKPDHILSVGIENDRHIGGCHGKIFKIKQTLRRFFNDSNGNAVNDKTPAMLQSYLTHHFTNNCYHATQKFIVDLYKNKASIATEFNDAGFDPRSGFINLTENYTAQCVSHALANSLSNVTRIEPAGMFIRNKCMTKRMEEMAEEHNSRFTVQICGQAHVNGMKKEHDPGINHECDHETSISGIHKSNDNNFMAIFTADEVAYTKELNLSEYFICSSMSKYSAKYAPVALTREYLSQEEIDEKKFVTGVYKALGLNNL